MDNADDAVEAYAAPADTALVDSFLSHLRGELRQGFFPFGLVICAVFIAALVGLGFPWGPILLGVAVIGAVSGSYRRWRNRRQTTSDS